MADGSRVAELLTKRPDLKSPLEDILEVDERYETWTFDDVRIDSGRFGELVSQGVVEKVDGKYRLADPDAVLAAIDQRPAGKARDAADDESEGWFSVSLPSVEVRAAGLLVGALAFIVVIRSYVLGAVFRGEHVVLAGNDPYFYRYWVEQLLTTGESLASVGGPTGGEPLMIVTLARISDLFGGVDAAGAVLAVYPVAAAVLTGLLLYLFTMRLTADRRVALAAVFMLAITPGHALRTALGFADHHAFDYIWLVLTALALLVLVDGNESQLRDQTTVLGALGLGAGVGGQILAWDNGALLVVPVAASVAGYVLLVVREGRSPGGASVPIVAGLALAAAITLLGHVFLGWHSLVVAAIPTVLLSGTIGVVVAGELVFRLNRSARELAVAEATIAIIAIVGTFQLVPDLIDRVRRGLGLIGRTDDIAEVAALFSGETMGFLLLFGFILFVALPMLILFSVRTYRDDASWLVPVVYAWFFIGLSLFQVRYVGEAAAFTAVFAGLGFVWLAAKVDITDLPVPFNGESKTEWVPERPDSSTIFAVVALFLLVGGLGVIQSAVKIEQITVEDGTYETASWMAEHADERGLEDPAESYVFSEWGRNRLYNYFVNGQSQSYQYAQRNYMRFIESSAAADWYGNLSERVGFIVVPDGLGMSNSTTYTNLQAQLDGRRTGGDPLKGISNYRAVYASPDGSKTVFTIVPGAVLTGRGESNSTVTVQTEVDLVTREMTYRQSVPTTEDGRFALRVPYQGTYEIPNGTVNVAENTLLSGGFIDSSGSRGLWSFEEGRGNVVYDSIGGAHGFVDNPAWVQGVQGQAIANTVRVPDAPSPTPDKGWSVSLWFKTSSNGTVVFGTAPINNSFSQTDGVHIGLNRKGRLISSVGQGDDQAYIGGPIVDNGWHHTVFSWNGTMTNLYVDGRHYGQAGYAGEIRKAEGFFLGYLGFEGRIDEVEVKQGPMPFQAVTQQYEEYRLGR